MGDVEVLVPSDESSQFQNWIITKRLQATCQMHAYSNGVKPVAIRCFAQLILVHIIVFPIVIFFDIANEHLKIGILSIPVGIVIAWGMIVFTCIILKPLLRALWQTTMYILYEEILEWAVRCQQIYRIYRHQSD